MLFISRYQVDLEDIQSEYERVNSQVAISEKKLMTFDKVDNLTSYFASLKDGLFNSARCTRFELQVQDFLNRYHEDGSIFIKT